MINILKSESGNIAIAMLLVVIGAMSGLTLSSIAFRDTMATMAELEDIQCIHFLRTEASRGEAYLKVAAKRDPETVGGVRTPERRIGMRGSDFKKTDVKELQQYFILTTEVIDYFIKNKLI